MREEVKGAEASRKLTIYLILTVMLVLLAAISFLLVPQGNSIGSCNRLAFASSRYACITSLALSQSNASVCGYAGASSDSCYMQVAEQTGNAGTCSSIQAPAILGACVSAIATASNNYSLCSNAGEPYASSCAASIAVSLDNATICTQIANSTYSIECSSIIGIRDAARTGNPAYCLNVSRSGNKNLTSYIIANVSAGSTYSQNSFVLNSLSLLPNVTFTARDYCYISLATRFYNPALCANVSAGEASTLCTEESGTYSTNATANYTKLLAACAQSGTYAQECTESVLLSEAVNTKNATMCSTLSNGLDTSCYSLLASTYKNATYCSYISNSSAKSSCVDNS